MSEPTENKLTPEQAADVIQHYYNGENEAAHKNNWSDKVSLEQAAIHAAMKSHSILPIDDDSGKKKALLTFQEMEAGLAHIENPPKTEEIKWSEEYENELDRLVQTGQFTYDDAQRSLEAKGWDPEKGSPDN